jgi:phospholipase C
VRVVVGIDQAYTSRWFDLLVKLGADRLGARTCGSATEGDTLSRSNRFIGVEYAEAVAQLTAHESFRLVRELAGPVIERAHAVDPVGVGSFGDIEHIVLLMQENRSFDHYFGTLSGVRGFDDVSDAFRQYGYAPGLGQTPNGYLNPFRLHAARGVNLHGVAINDPTHDWAPQHQSWNGGAMDQWVKAHIEADGALNGPVTMGYYTRSDIPVHYALADAFTVCDHYFSSVMGPTDPNRLYWISGTLDPDGQHGGPLLYTPTTKPGAPTYAWRTYPEALEEAGVSWKIYQDQNIEVLSDRFLSGMLERFVAFGGDESNPLRAKGITPTYPHDFEHDVRNNTLPQVSWIVPSLLTCEHPALPAAFGAMGIIQVLDILTSNPEVWEKTALIVSYDENGGLFDHVAPPTAPPGTPGEYISAPLGGVREAEGIAGPIGLGFRVPCMVISPYSRGGLVASDVFDHTSQLRLIERRFGVPVPNLTAWRRSTVGDLTSAFDFFDQARPKRPRLPDPDFAALRALIEGNINILLGFGGRAVPYTIPPNSMPTQETGPLRRSPRGIPADGGW